MKCPGCHSERIVQGRYLDQIGGGIGQVFRPEELKTLILNNCDIRVPDGDRFRACLNCGLLWSTIDNKKLTAVLKKHGKEKVKQRLGLSDPRR